MHLIIDQGNTSTKYAVLNPQGEILYRTVLDSIDAQVVQQLQQQYLPQYIFISTVKAGYETIAGTLPVNNPVFFDENCRIPVINRYTTPETLGRDRLAGICGAIKLFPGKNCLVIDAGTCITYDFIDAGKNYYGGSISPGLEMRLKALHYYTGKLPLVPLQWIDDFTGNSTATSIQTGVAQGVVNEIEGFIRRYRNKWGEISVLMCGGDTVFLAERCESEIFAAPDLVLMGLNEILKYNTTHAV